MSWLKVIGLAILKGTQIIAGILPVVKAVAPTSASTTLDKLEQAVGVVVTAETMVGAMGIEKGGIQKMKASGPFIAQLILQLDAVKDLKLDESRADEFKAACEGVGGNLAAALNCFKPK